ncbi:uncharacterized protein METZ01_LOCUS58714 [marine metagenome]|uniref:Uncharacterized protein n=1 Tax=marine metagenome TaxID=408172 RepID=A0A381SPA2_9ZZZZ
MELKLMMKIIITVIFLYPVIYLKMKLKSV